jgi:HK97 family phage major capsid protein
MNSTELIEKRAKAWEAAKNFLDSHRNESGILSAEDSETYDRMEKDITDLTKEIERLNRQKQIEDELSKPMDTPLTAKPGVSDEGPKKTGRASDEYRKAMITAMRTHYRQVSDYLNEGNDAKGG